MEENLLYRDLARADLPRFPDGTISFIDDHEVDGAESWNSVYEVRQDPQEGCLSDSNFSEEDDLLLDRMSGSPFFRSLLILLGEAPEGSPTLEVGCGASVSESPTQSHRQFAISGRNLNDNWGTVPATVTDGVWSLQYWPNKDLAYKGPKPVRQETYPNTGMPERRVDELFDLRVDPDQSNNVLHEHPQEAARLHAALLELIELGETDAEVARTYEPLPGAG